MSSLFDIIIFNRVRIMTNENVGLLNESIDIEVVFLPYSDIISNVVIKIGKFER